MIASTGLRPISDIAIMQKVDDEDFSIFERSVEDPLLLNTSPSPISLPFHSISRSSTSSPLCRLRNNNNPVVFTTNGNNCYATNGPSCSASALIDSEALSSASPNSRGNGPKVQVLRRRNTTAAVPPSFPLVSSSPQLQREYLYESHNLENFVAPALDEGCSIVTDKNTNLDDVNVIYAKRPSLPGLDIALGRKRSNSLSPYPYSLQQARAAELVQEEAAEGEKRWHSRRSTSNSMLYQHSHNHNHNHSHDHNHSRDHHHHHPHYGVPRKGTDFSGQPRDCSAEPWTKVSDGRVLSDFKHSNKNGANRQHQPRLLRFYSYVDMVNDENLGRHCLLHGGNRGCGSGNGNSNGNGGNGSRLLRNFPARYFYSHRDGSGGDSGRSGSNVGDYFFSNPGSSTFSRSASESGHSRTRPGRHLSFGSGVVGAVGPGGSYIVNRAAEMQQGGGGGGGGVLNMTPLRARADSSRGGVTSTATAGAAAGITASVSSGSSSSSSRSSISGSPNETTDKLDGVKGARRRRSSVQSIDDTIQEKNGKRTLLEPFTRCVHPPTGESGKKEAGCDIRELISKFHLDFGDSDQEGEEES